VDEDDDDDKQMTRGTNCLSKVCGVNQQESKSQKKKKARPSLYLWTYDGRTATIEMAVRTLAEPSVHAVPL
jgi:hypothetical protein